MLQLLIYHPVLMAAAVLPAVFLLVRVYRADRLEREPPRLLLGLLLWGILATIPAILGERVGSCLLALVCRGNTRLNRILLCFIVVGGSEEGAKYLLLKWRTWRSPHFNCRFDGVVYAVFVSLGFALWENIGYVAMYGFRTALLRAVTAVPGHACFGVFMGTWYGLAKALENEGDAEAARLSRCFAFLLPALLHGCYDAIAMAQSLRWSWVFVIFVILLFVISFRMVKRLSRQDRFI